MMSSAGTSRASRSSKDKTVKIQQTQNVKSEGPPTKNQVGKSLLIRDIFGSRMSVLDMSVR